MMKKVSGNPKEGNDGSLKIDRHTPKTLKAAWRFSVGFASISLFQMELEQLVNQ